MRWLRRASLAGLACAAVWSMVTHWLGWRFGMGIWPVPAGTGWPYQLESGFVPALTVLSLLGTIVSLYHLHNCHRDDCWRIGKHKVDGTPWCSRHEAEARQQTQQQVTLDAIAARLDQIIGLMGRP